jgi:transposase
LNGANPFDYLTQLQRNIDQVTAKPELWMPWNYREALTDRRQLFLPFSDN